MARRLCIFQESNSKNQINYEFTITEPGGETKVGVNNQWIKVKDSANEGYVAAWFVGH